MRDGGADDHGARMDGVYRWTRHVYDASRKYYLLGRDPLIRDMAVVPGQTVCEIGCGTGRNLRRIAGLYPNARLYGVDASDLMLEKARATMARAGTDAVLVQGFAEKLAIDDFGPTAPQAGFDHVLFPYSLSMIPDWRGALDRAAALLAPGGHLHAVDFGSMAAWPGPVCRSFDRFLAAYHVTIRAELPDVLADLPGLNMVQAKTIAGGYAQRYCAQKRVSAP